MSNYTFEKRKVPNFSLIAGLLVSAYSLIWGSHEILGKGWLRHLGTFMISRHI